MIEQSLLKEAVSQGLWAVLFISLYIHQLRESKERESKLMGFLTDISKQFEALARQYEHLNVDITEIKQEMRRE